MKNSKPVESQTHNDSRGQAVRELVLIYNGWTMLE